MLVSSESEFRDALKAVQPGETITVNDGAYSGQFNLRNNGELQKPIRIQAKNRWKAWVDPSGDYGDGIDLHTECHDIILDGFRVTGARTIGIRASKAERVKVLNCLVENCHVQGILIYGRSCTVSGCYIRRNGVSGQHHGLYISGEKHTIFGNVFDHNAGYGLHCYPEINNSMISYNQAYGHDIKSGLLIYAGRNNYMLGNHAWNNRVNFDVRDPESTKMLGNRETEKEFPFQENPD